MGTMTSFRRRRRQGEAEDGFTRSLVPRAHDKSGKSRRRGEAEDGFTTELGSDGIATAGGGRGRIRDGARSQSTAGKAEDRLATELGAAADLENGRHRIWK
ncbi:hypothetical protein TIFTF001_014558 [Ficus carica]|uniref:Uncharacterized protein n=1 Tax=Ficus carica TaxID=3494 RepID=A0AA88D729_FICCA|nr:hypothetical protein TIFTF001_014558 [Ficus carica]